MSRLRESTAEVLRFLEIAAKYNDPNPGRSHITGLEHGLRLATLLERRHSDLFLAFGGLVHDLARPLNDVFHGEIIAEVVRDRVPPYVYHVLRTHGLYQEAIIHGLPRPEHSWEVLEESKPHNLNKICLMFGACEALTFDPKYPELVKETWSYERGKQFILDVLY